MPWQTVMKTELGSLMGRIRGSYFGMTRDVLIPEFDPVDLSYRLIPDQNFAYVEEKTYKDQSGDIDGYFADGQSNSDSRTQSQALSNAGFSLFPLVWPPTFFHIETTTGSQ